MLRTLFVKRHIQFSDIKLKLFGLMTIHIYKSKIYIFMNTLVRRVLLFMLPLSLGGCAALLNDSIQTLTVRTDCEKAVLNRVCNASFNSQKITFVTPAKLRIPRSAQSITLNCQGGLLHGASQDVNPEISKVIAGNVLLGGAVGLVIDLNTERAFTYPSVTNIVMPICQHL